jgi:hypothetical protein
VWQQAEELAQLQSLQRAGNEWTAAPVQSAAHPLPVVDATPIDAQSVDRLAGWLLSAAGLAPAEAAPGGRS